MALCRYVVVLLYFYIWHCSQVITSLWHYDGMSLYRYGVITICRYIVISLYVSFLRLLSGHDVIVLLYCYVVMSLQRYVVMSLCHTGSAGRAEPFAMILRTLRHCQGLCLYLRTRTGSS